ncbi:MAG: hypothetical protein HXS46_11560 [Theionarchaea archaeon]|nr:MAG: hypothetical protein AYK18_11085 [Theionarchaea archaeon DG-70]MBU7011317.1 hypothetical protein [Theionarchaea archaeon]
MNHMGKAVVVCLLCALVVCPAIYSQACPRKGIVIKISLDLDTAEHSLDLEGKHYISGVREYLSGSRFRGILYRSRYDPAIGVLLTESYLLVSMDENDGRNIFEIDWETIVERELTWLSSSGSTDVTSKDIESIVAVTKCCGGIEKTQTTWKWFGRRCTGEGLDLSDLPIDSDASPKDETHAFNLWLVVPLAFLGLFLLFLNRKISR